MAAALFDEQAIFDAARKLDSREAREAYLQQACGNNETLGQRVRALLKAYEESASFLEPAARPDATIDEPATERAGAVIGPYKLLEQIGEGGFGVVFMAEQTEPVRRKVALKILKPGMDTRQVVARFEAERQALAIMDHPNIAKVFDGGTTPPSPPSQGGAWGGGRPYFVMELVKGTPITDFCDQNHLTPRQRLELFIPVCQAVQHAHQKGIIHRDLKPSNILVVMHDTAPVPKVIDFGVAKALGQELTDKTLFTGFAQMIGTPLYMSPEQAGQSGLDVDTRSDIYSLGVLLYELLTGTTPFSKERFKQAAYDEIRRIIREEEPSKPSTKLSTAEGLPTLAANRGTEPAKLTKLVRGELDWIVMKALEKDRSRRYETANGFAADVQRYLADEPVLACPPSAGYRLRKFVRRNKGPVVGIMTVLLVLIAGVVGTALGLVEAKRQEGIAIDKAALEAQQREKAEENERTAKLERKKAEAAAQAEENARQQTQARLEQIQKGNKLLGSIFADLDLRKLKEEGQQLELVLGDRLKAAAADLKGEAVGDPLVVAELQTVLAESLRGLGYYQEAINLDDEVRATRTRLLGPNNSETLACMNNLGRDYLYAGQFGKALSLLEETLERMKTSLGTEDALTLVCMGNLAAGYLEAGQIRKGVPLLEETFTLMKKKYGPENLTTLISMHNLAAAYRETKLDKALPLLEEAYRRMKKAPGPDHPSTLLTVANLAAAYVEARQFDKGLPLAEETFTRQRAKLGPDHHATLVSMINLASGYREAGQVDKALQLGEEAFTRAKATLGPDHHHTLWSMGELGSTYAAAQRFDKALPLLEHPLTRMKATLGPNHPRTLGVMRCLATGYRDSGRLDKALPLLEEALPRLKAKFGLDHPDTLEVMHNLGVAYMATRQLDQALPLLEESLKRTKTVYGPDHPETLDSMLMLASAYRETGKLSQLEMVLVEAVALQRRKAADSLELASSLAMLGKCLLDQNKFPNAEPTLKECLTLREKAEPDAWTTFNTKSLLGGALLGQKKYADAEPLLLAGYKEMKRRSDKIPVEARALRLIEAVERLVALYEATGKNDEAAKWRKELDAAKAKKDKTDK